MNIFTFLHHVNPFFGGGRDPGMSTLASPQPLYVHTIETSLLVTSLGGIPMLPEAGGSSQWHTDVRPHSHYIQVSSLMTFFSDAAEMRAPSLYYSHSVNLSDLLRYSLALVNGHDLRFDQFCNTVLVQGEDKYGTITTQSTC